MSRLSSIVSAALVTLIRIYQRVASPVLSVAFGPNCGCRFAPTCSHYAVAAIQTHGPFLGAWLSVRRFLKCTPLHPGGLDPVPARSYRCTRVTLPC